MFRIYSDIHLFRDTEYGYTVKFIPQTDLAALEVYQTVQTNVEPGRLIFG